MNYKEILQVLTEKDTDVTKLGDTQLGASPITLQMRTKHVWDRFSDVQTEMILKPGGRKMFPFVSLNVEGLEEESLYTIKLVIAQISDQKYRYVAGEWSGNSKAEPPNPEPVVDAPDSPNYGHHFMRSGICFRDVLITNNKECEQGKMMIWLNSLHKHQPLLLIFKHVDSDLSLVLCKSLEMCQFIGVTMYQDEDVIKEKVENNPFAKHYADPRFRQDEFRKSDAARRLNYLMGAAGYDPSLKDDPANEHAYKMLLLYGKDDSSVNPGYSGSMDMAVPGPSTAPSHLKLNASHQNSIAARARRAGAPYIGTHLQASRSAPDYFRITLNAMFKQQWESTYRDLYKDK